MFHLRLWPTKRESSQDPAQPANQSTAQARQLCLSIHSGFNFPLMCEGLSLNHAPDAILWNTKIKVFFVSSVLKQLLLLVLCHCPCFQVHTSFLQTSKYTVPSFCFSSSKNKIKPFLAFTLSFAFHIWIWAYPEAELPFSFVQLLLPNCLY